jgi:hypothetical protein
MEDRNEVQFVPRFEDGVHFYEVYIPSHPEEGTISIAEGEAWSAAQDLAEKYNTKVNEWKGWY